MAVDTVVCCPDGAHRLCLLLQLLGEGGWVTGRSHWSLPSLRSPFAEVSSFIQIDVVFRGTAHIQSLASVLDLRTALSGPSRNLRRPLQWQPHSQDFLLCSIPPLRTPTDVAPRASSNKPPACWSPLQSLPSRETWLVVVRVGARKQMLKLGHPPAG